MHTGTWNGYTGSGAIILAIVLLLITGALVYAGLRLRRTVRVRRPGKALGVAIIIILTLSVFMFLIASTTYVLAFVQQKDQLSVPGNPITPVTFSAALVTFIIVIIMSQQRGPAAAIGSAIVGTIAAPLIFELPFDLIVMWRTYPPAPHALFTLLYFIPLFLIEVSSFALLSLSPLVNISRLTLLLLASMFLIFAIWAAFGFGYPSAPLPIAFNAIAKLLAFATAVSLFIPEARMARAFTSPQATQAREATPAHPPSQPVVSSSPTGSAENI